jgi:hypothetical protein
MSNYETVHVMTLGVLTGCALVDKVASLDADS